MTMTPSVNMTANVAGVAITMSVEADVFDVGRRLREGDPTLGWRGDPMLSLRIGVPVDPVTGELVRSAPHRYEVWGADAFGQGYMILAWPRCDASLLAELVRVTATPLAARVQKAQAAAEKARKDRDHETFGALADKLAWALRRDIGEHFGGLRKTVHAVSDQKKEEPCSSQT